MHKLLVHKLIRQNMGMNVLNAMHAHTLTHYYRTACCMRHGVMLKLEILGEFCTHEVTYQVSHGASESTNQQHASAAP